MNMQSSYPPYEHISKKKITSRFLANQLTALFAYYIITNLLQVSIGINLKDNSNVSRNEKCRMGMKNIIKQLLEVRFYFLFN